MKAGVSGTARCAGIVVLAWVSISMATSPPALADFTLMGSAHMDVNSNNVLGVLWDASSADVVPPMGRIENAYVNNEATLRVRLTSPSWSACNEISAYDRGSIEVWGGVVNRVYAYNQSAVLLPDANGRIAILWAHDSASVDIYGGSVYFSMGLWDTSGVLLRAGQIDTLRAYDASTAQIVDGIVGHLFAEANAGVDISGGSFYAVEMRNFSTVNMSDGNVSETLACFDTSSADISGGSIKYVKAYNTSRANFTAGDVTETFFAYNSSSATIGGGAISTLVARDLSNVDITGGHIETFLAREASTTTLHGYGFVASEGLTLNGDLVLGIGVLTGKWLDGSPWTMTVSYHDPTATIRAIPEPGVLAFLALGGLMIARRTRARRGAFPSRPPARRPRFCGDGAMRGARRPNRAGRGTRISVVLASAIALIGARPTRADFSLAGTSHLNVTTSHEKGELWDSSSATVLTGGYVTDAFVYDDALLAVQRPSGLAAGRIWAYGNSSVEVSGGQIGTVYLLDQACVTVAGSGAPNYLRAYDTSRADIAGGAVTSTLAAENNSTVTIRGGSIEDAYARADSRIVMTGGSVSYLRCYGTSETEISGGTLSILNARDTSAIAVIGYGFRTTGGLVLEGQEVIGTGVLSGIWFDSDAPFSILINLHDPGASIHAVPEPATLGLLAVGGAALFNRRRRGGRIISG